MPHRFANDIDLAGLKLRGASGLTDSSGNPVGVRFDAAQTPSATERRQARENLGIKTLAVTAQSPGASITHNMNDASAVFFLPSGSGLWEAVANGANALTLRGPEGETFSGVIVIIANP